VEEERERAYQTEVCKQGNASKERTPKEAKQVLERKEVPKMTMNPKEIKEWVKTARDKELKDMQELLGYYGDEPGKFVTEQKKRKIVEREINKRSKSIDSTTIIANQLSFSF